MTARKVYLNSFKPLIDKILAFSLLLILSPLLLITTVILLVVNAGKVFFFHVRIGKGEKTFHLIKFKTMREINGSEDELRVTSFGSILRKISVDELPQLLNVLRGEMSLVGPRPLLVEYMPYYDEEEKERHSVKPGITGWAQVNGRNMAGWDQRMKDDVYYVENVSFWLDLKILVLTAFQLFKFSQADFVALDQETFSDYVKRTRSR